MRKLPITWVMSSTLAMGVVWELLQLVDRENGAMDHEAAARKRA